MGSVAAALRERGYRVTGSDAEVYPPMSTFLEESGVLINDGFREENIPDNREIKGQGKTTSTWVSSSLVTIRFSLK